MLVIDGDRCPRQLASKSDGDKCFEIKLEFFALFERFVLFPLTCTKRKKVVSFAL